MITPDLNTFYWICQSSRRRNRVGPDYLFDKKTSCHLFSWIFILTMSIFKPKNIISKETILEAHLYHIAAKLLKMAESDFIRDAAKSLLQIDLKTFHHESR